MGALYPRCTSYIGTPHVIFNKSLVIGSLTTAGHPVLLLLLLLQYTAPRRGYTAGFCFAVSPTWGPFISAMYTAQLSSNRRKNENRVIIMSDEHCSTRVPITGWKRKMTRQSDLIGRQGRERVYMRAIRFYTLIV